MAKEIKEFIAVVTMIWLIILGMWFVVGYCGDIVEEHQRREVFQCLDQHTLSECQIKYNALK